MTIFCAKTPLGFVNTPVYVLKTVLINGNSVHFLKNHVKGGTPQLGTLE